MFLQHKKIVSSHPKLSIRIMYLPVTMSMQAFTRVRDLRFLELIHSIEVFNLVCLNLTEYINSVKLLGERLFKMFSIAVLVPVV